MTSKLEFEGKLLDLTFVHDRLLVMGNPYRSDLLTSYRKFFSSRFRDNYRIYNLAVEPDFNIEIDLQNVENFAFNAHNPAALLKIIKLCISMENFLSLDARNIAAIHCKTGKGRSCMMAACFLLHAGHCKTAKEAIEHVCSQRTPEYFDAVAVPSQIRYIKYYEGLLMHHEVTCFTFKLKHVRINTVPACNSSISVAGCTPHLTVSLLSTPDASINSVEWYPRKVFDYTDHVSRTDLPRYYAETDDKIDFSLSKHNVLVRGDVCISFFSQDEKICQLYINTSFLVDNRVLMSKDCIDMACDDVQHLVFNRKFSIELQLERVKDHQTLNVIPDQEHTATQSDESTTPTKTLARPMRQEDFEHMYSYGDTNIIESDDDD